MVGSGKGKRSVESRVPQRLLSTADVPQGTFPVIDPQSRKLFVPFDAMIDTLAMHRAGVPSLCRLHLEGRCRQGNSCHQAHAQTDVIMRLREAALQEPTCCEGHGARSNTFGLPKHLTIIVVGNKEGEKILETTLAYVAVSRGLCNLVENQGLYTNAPENPSVVVPVNSLCRLHSSEPCCRFGPECSFVHLCRDLITHTGMKSKSQKKFSSCEDQHVNITRTAAEASVSVCEKPKTITAITAIASPKTTEINTRNTLPPSTEQSISVVDSSPSHFTSPLGIIFNRHCGAGLSSLSASPKLSTSPVLARSHTSTSSGVFWRHNPYAGSSSSSVIET